MNYFYHTKGALMAKKELKCQKFFQQLLNIHAQIEEKTDELNYWQSQYDPCSADQALSTEIQRRTEELQGLIRYRSCNHPNLLTVLPSIWLTNKESFKVIVPSHGEP